ncbi:hypothetical protein N7481_000209 [Penicillium waksmanii]|uniref:uncharacterized protein n=1 Tax=Penicillium waksmanii TaxID=69791 RepID=UPI002547F254|nr:uncharacterized protein N7481_000209 [Penicillium waksmanii]KAJ5999800.1 hypothetical protein N7481_000209 [Penicillium waksmanii]
MRKRVVKSQRYKMIPILSKMHPQHSLLLKVNKHNKSDYILMISPILCRWLVEDTQVRSGRIRKQPKLPAGFEIDRS